MIDFILKKGDTHPILRAYLKDANNNPVDLSGCFVKFNHKMKKSSTVVSDTVNITNAVNGVIEFTFSTADTTTTGYYEGEFVITFSDDRELTIPQDSFILYQVAGDIS